MSLKIKYVKTKISLKLKCLKTLCIEKTERTENNKKNKNTEETGKKKRIKNMKVMKRLKRLICQNRLKRPSLAHLKIKF